MTHARTLIEMYYDDAEPSTITAYIDDHGGVTSPAEEGSDIGTITFPDGSVVECGEDGWHDGEWTPED